MKTIILVLWVAVTVAVTVEEIFGNQISGGQVPGPQGPEGLLNFDTQVSESQVGLEGQELIRTGRALYGDGGGGGGGNQGGFGGSGGRGGQGGRGGGFPSAPARYNFQWDVNDQSSGNFYGHGEERDGDNTQGNYYVQLPDSRRLLVKYVVDQNGYHPTVTFEGEAQHPTGGGGSSGGGGGYYQ